MINYKTIDGTSYAYSLTGSGDVPLVLLHGFTGTKATWNKFISLCSEKYRILTIDLPGHGETITKKIVTMEQFANHLYELTRFVHFEAFHLLGYSLGGRSALSYAMYYPETIRSLILESASPGLKTKEERQSRVEQDKNLAKMITSEGLKRFVSYWENIPLFESQKTLPKSVRQNIRIERLSQSGPRLVQSLFGMGTGAQPSWWDSLHTITFPVLLVVGALDEKFVQINRSIASRIENSSLQIVNGAGHTIHLEQPEKFVKIVMEYIEKISE